MKNSGRGRAWWLCTLLAESGQALPLALIALAIGAVLVTPFLTDVSVNLLASRKTDEAIADYYSVDAGIEWGLWRLKNNPTLTTSTSYEEAPLQPTPASINGDSFPTTEVRFASGAGASESITPTWQEGDGEQCYPVTTTDSGLIFAVVDTDASSVWVALLSESADCAKPDGLAPASGTSPYTVQFGPEAAGSYQVLVATVGATTGALAVHYPIASYDLRSERDGRTITSRATASMNAVTIISWQLD